MMNFLSMKYFIYLSAEKNFTRAANELHITQQTLSAHISELEKELNTVLVIRSNPLRLTVNGELFLNYAEDIYNKYIELNNSLCESNKNQSGRIILGLESEGYIRMIPDIISEFQRNYPNIEINISNYSTKELYKKLTNREIDLAVSWFGQDMPNMCFSDFYTDEILLAVPLKFLDPDMNYPAYISDLSLFYKMPFILDTSPGIVNDFAESILNSSEFVPKFRCRSENLQLSVTLALNNVGICFCTKSVIKTTVLEGSMSRFRFFHFNKNSLFSYKFAFRKDVYMRKIIDEFVLTARDISNRHCDTIIF